jgi:pimeloyl-ACP methyl ester carboxylesterase
MSSIVTDRGIVHYETYSRGQPVVLLHCWMGSWSYWYSTMEFLGARGYKTYALDFWGFGDSAKQGSFTVDEYVEMVDQFMERMGLVRAPVMGHSMGGTVTLSLALDHPDRVSKLAIIGSPIVGSGLSLLLKISGYQQVGWLLYSTGLLPFIMKALALSFAKDWRTLMGMFERDLSRTTMESFSKSIRDLRETDLRPRLHELQIPTMGIFGRKDNIVTPKQGEVLKKHMDRNVVHYFEGSGHFPMLDETDQFHAKIYSFLNDAG